jgi:hypothetical protein
MQNTSVLLPDLAVIRKSLEDALVEQGKKLGYSFELGTVEYEPDGNFSLELLAVRLGNYDDEEKRYLEMAGLLPLPNLHSVIVVDNDATPYTVAGLTADGADVVLLSGEDRWLYGVRALSTWFERTFLAGGANGGNSN